VGRLVGDGVGSDVGRFVGFDVGGKVGGGEFVHEGESGVGYFPQSSAAYA
jgi:hypothetical protein